MKTTRFLGFVLVVCLFGAMFAGGCQSKPEPGSVEDVTARLNTAADAVETVAKENGGNYVVVTVKALAAADKENKYVEGEPGRDQMGFNSGSASSSYYDILYVTKDGKRFMLMKSDGMIRIFDSAGKMIYQGA